MSATAKPLPLKQLDARMKSVWRRSQMLQLTSGALAFCRWAVLMFIAGVAVDWMLEIPTPGRVVILTLLLTISLYKAWQCGWRNLHAFNATHTALQLETHHGGLESLLVSAVQLRDPKVVAGMSESLRARTCSLAEDAAADLSPEKAVPFRLLRRPAILILTLAGLLGSFAVVNGPFLMSGLSRIFTPWLAVEYPTYTQLDLAVGDLVIKQGASAQIEARVSGIVPNQAKLLLQTGAGRPREIPLDITDGQCEYTLASASRDFTYQIKAGDARSAWHQVRVVPAPRFKQVKVGLEFPTYLERPTKIVEALTLTVPEGTGVDWELTLDQPISEAVFIRDGEEQVELQVSQDGRRVNFNAVAADSRGYCFSWVEKEHGFRFTSPRYFLQVVSDRPPQVELTSPPTNLFAMPGRPLELVVRARDDHAIANANIAYRVNRRSEKSVALSSPILNGKGDHPIDWNYQNALPDLGVGDTVSFAVEVSDRYPGPKGPHQARSETRRITFLSKEEYLMQMGRKRDRLLSRVRTIYRQERAAHELIRLLDPSGSPSVEQQNGLSANQKRNPKLLAKYQQTCQLEAIRQEMIRNQLNETAKEVQVLLDDLAANHVSDAPEGDSLVHVRSTLQAIAEEHIAVAASLLRGQVGATEGGGSTTLDPTPATRLINTAARELGSLVMLRDIDSAQEVFARETHMFALLQVSLRRDALEARAALSQTDESPDQKPLNSNARQTRERLAKQQEDLAQWTDRLLPELQSGMRYTKRPLAVLRLTRSIKELRDSKAVFAMREAATLIRQGKIDQAEKIQAKLVQSMLKSEFSVRPSGEYATLMRARNLLVSLVHAQQELRMDYAGVNTEQFDNRRAELTEVQTNFRKELLLMLLPSIPAARPLLFDDTIPESPPTTDLLADADQALANALNQIAAGQKEATADQQLAAEKAMATLAEIVDQWSIELGLKTQGLSTLVTAASERLLRIEEYEAWQIELLEKLDIAAAEGKKVESLAEPQQILTEEVAGFRKELFEQNQLLPEKDVLPIISRLNQVEQAMGQAVDALKNNLLDDAFEHQEQGADALAQARSLVAAQSERLDLLQDLYMFQRAVGFAKGYVTDIVAEQRDLIVATEAVKAEQTAGLLPVFSNLQKCLVDVAPLLDLVAARLDVGTPLVFAGTDLEDAMASLEDGDLLDAVDAQEVAAESLAEVQILVQAVQTQTGYVAEIVEFLHRSLSDSAMMQFQIEELSQKVKTASSQTMPALVAEQRAIAAKAKTYGQQLEKVTGLGDYSIAEQQINAALKPMEANETLAAVKQLELAHLTLVANAEVLLPTIRMLHGLPSIEITAQSPKELIRLIDVLSVASVHQGLLRQTSTTPADDIASLIKKQRELEMRCKQLVEEEQPHPKLGSALQYLSSAVSALQASDWNEVKLNQKAADTQLRQFIVEQALILETAAAISAGTEGAPTDDGPGSDSESAFAAGFISDFVSGEAPKDKRTEWKVLGDRNRAALNQNFARELPLEYRGLLKNYYERVAK